MTQHRVVPAAVLDGLLRHRPGDVGAHREGPRAAGEQRKLTIDGGVKVTLNTGTSVNVRSDDASQDRIEILTGEAVIAAGSASREVRVVAGDGEMRAHQAQFNVRHDQRSTCVVTCLDGEVRVNRHSSVATLRAGQQVSYAALGLAAPMSVDPAEVTAWRDGMLIFHDAPLRNVVTEINRYRSGKVMVTNAELERRLVNEIGRASCRERV
mgnify:CR=1 FL=1